MADSTGGAGGVVNAGTGFGGGKGGWSITSTTYTGGGGGGAGGYTGSGGNGGVVGGAYPSSIVGYWGSSGSGGGGGGGASGTNATGTGGGGGGVGVLGAGFSGSAGTTGAQHGGGGGGGSNGYRGSTSTTVSSVNTSALGGLYGGGGGARPGAVSGLAGLGANGVVRILWPGTTRSFPSTSTTDVSNMVSGQIRYNSATIATVTTIFLSTTMAAGTNIATYLATWNTSSNTIKGQLVITDTSNSTFLNVFNVTGVVISPTSDYYQLTVTYVSGTMPTDTQELSVNFFRSGDLGYVGSSGSTPRINTLSTTSSISIDSSLYDQYIITSLSESFTINTAAASNQSSGRKMIIRIKDNGTSRFLTFSGYFRGIGVTLPTVTTSGKTMYIGCIWNTNDGVWDVIAVAVET